MLTKKGFFCSAFCIFVFSTGVFGQQKADDQATVKEDFQLNITNKQVTETNYNPKLEVAVKSETEPQVRLQVGAEVKAEKVTMTLKNIFGDVRFRGSLERILNQINLRRPPVNQ